MSKKARCRIAESFFYGWHYEGEKVNGKVRSPNALLYYGATNTELKFAEPGKCGYQHQGEGTLRLTKDALHTRVPFKGL